MDPISQREGTKSEMQNDYERLEFAGSEWVQTPASRQPGSRDAWACYAQPHCTSHHRHSRRCDRRYSNNRTLSLRTSNWSATTSTIPKLRSCTSCAGISNLTARQIYQLGCSPQPFWLCQQLLFVLARFPNADEPPRMEH